MYQTLNKNITAILLLGTIFFASHASATDCYALSPNLVDAEDKYYDLENTNTLSAKEKKSVNNFFRNLTGKWKGKATLTECSGPDSAPRIKTRHAVLTLKANLASNGSLSLSADKDYQKERVSRPENLALLSNAPLFEYEFINDNHFVFFERLRRMNIGSGKVVIPKNAASSNTQTVLNKTSVINDAVYQVPKVKKNKTSRITETRYDVNLTAGRFIFTRAYYTNGVYTGEEQWTLRRY